MNAFSPNRLVFCFFLTTTTHQSLDQLANRAVRKEELCSLSRTMCILVIIQLLKVNISCDLVWSPISSCVFNILSNLHHGFTCLFISGSSFLQFVEDKDYSCGSLHPVDYFDAVSLSPRYD